MNYWILKTEPSTYSFDDLVKERRTTWDGVANPVAQKHIRSMAPGDAVLIYHTGSEKRIVGHATVASEPYADPKDKAGKLTVVDLTAGKPAASPVTLAAIKADEAFAEMALVRQGRLSVVPATAAQYRKLVKMSEG